MWHGLEVMHQLSSKGAGCHLPERYLQAKNYLVANPGGPEGASRNAVIAAEKLCGKRKRAGTSQWQGRVSVTSHKGVERVGDFLCTEWPDHVPK